MKEYRVILFDSEELNREVRVYIMLPKNYDKGDKFYPVLYMHDGQNLFDDELAYKNMSWKILDAYENNPDLPELIIVGIENGKEERSNELVPFKFNFTNFEMSEYGTDDVGGKTDDYLKFITNSLKYYIDKNFRTFRSPKNTGLMGSSFGGVCSTYAALKYTKYFSRFGCVSNAYYVIQDELERLALDSDLSQVKKLYMDIGTKESKDEENALKDIESNQRIFDILNDKMDHSKIEFKIIKDAVHNELAWRIRFPDIIKFLFDD